MHPLDSLLLEAGARRVFGVARACVWKGGRQVWSGGTTPVETQFDLASVTKVMSTTALFHVLARDRRQARVREFFPQAAVDASLEDLLFHRSGLPPFLSYFEQALQTFPALCRADCPATTRATARAEVVARALATPPTAPVGRAAVYSDVGFQILGEVLAKLGGAPLDALFQEHLAAPLSLSAGYRRLSERRPLPAHLASTGLLRPREPAPGQEGLWSVPSHRGEPGEVDDDNAWAMDGVSGHAGLFGTADDAARFGQAVLVGRFGEFSRDLSTPGTTRALGFDTPSAEGASCGPRFGTGPRGAVGHLGFTGTSLWVDFDRQLVVALLTNRTVFGRANQTLRDFRPRFHDAVISSFP